MLFSNAKMSFIIDAQPAELSADSFVFPKNVEPIDAFEFLENIDPAELPPLPADLKELLNDCPFPDRSESMDAILRQESAIESKDAFDKFLDEWQITDADFRHLFRIEDEAAGTAKDQNLSDDPLRLFIEEFFPEDRAQDLPVEPQDLPVEPQDLPVEPQDLPVEPQDLPVKKRAFPVKRLANASKSAIRRHDLARPVDVVSAKRFYSLIESEQVMVQVTTHSGRLVKHRVCGICKHQARGSHKH
jgi:hypothetical protein